MSGRWSRCLLAPFQLDSPHGGPRRRSNRLLPLGSHRLAQVVGTALAALLAAPSSASALALQALAQASPFARAESPRETARQALDRSALGEAQRLWQLRRTRSAIEALERAAKQPELAAEAQERLGRIYFFRGWESEGAFPGWHEEPEYRDKALEAFRAAARARPEWVEQIGRAHV